MRILVTGGAGYIGSHTCKLLTRHGLYVTVYDDLSTGWRDLAKWGPLVEGSILDQEKLTATLKKNRINAVLHFAAKSCVGESVQDPGSYFSTNVSGTLYLLKAMRDAGVSNLVLSSTCAVYGHPTTLPIADNESITPLSPYGASKAFAERMMADFAHAHGLKWVSLRYFNAAGADPEGETGERHRPETHLIPRVLMAAAGKLPQMDIYGTDYDTPDGTCIRDYIHVDDLARAHLLALEHTLAGNACGAFNLGTGSGYSVKEIIEASKRITGKNIVCSYKQRRPGDPPQLVANAALAKEILGWQPEHSHIDHIIETAWRWLRADT